MSQENRQNIEVILEIQNNESVHDFTCMNYPLTLELVFAAKAYTEQ